MSVWPASVCSCVYCGCGDQKRAPEPLGLVLKTAVSLLCQGSLVTPPARFFFLIVVKIGVQ